MIAIEQLVAGQRVRLTVDIDRGRNKGATGVLKQVRPDAFNPNAPCPWGVVFDHERGEDMERIVVLGDLAGGESVRLVDVCEVVNVTVIYVDELRSYPAPPKKGAERFFGNSKRSCHLSTDGNLEELHKFAESIGLKRNWFQSTSSIPHYDLTPNKRALAINRGAVEVSTIDLIKLCKPLNPERLSHD